MSTDGEVTPVCPVCRSPCTEPPLHRYGVREAATFFCSPTRDPNRHARFVTCIRRLWAGETSAVYRCPSCRLGFGWPFVGGDEEFYSLMHEMAGYPGWRWDYDVTIKHVLPRYPRGGRILDIGTGSGNFLKGLGREWEKFATEGSETMRRVIREGGITCFADNAEALEQTRGSFDVVSMFQVLEHIAAFDDMLADCCALLRSGGALVIGVPFGDATLVQEEITGCPDMPPNHINKWTPQALEIALRRAGLEPLPPMFEPASWKLAAYRAWLRVRARAFAEPSSLAAKTYSIRSRRRRLPLIAGLTMLSFLRCVPNLGRMRQGHSFAMVGLKP